MHVIEALQKHMNIRPDALAEIFESYEKHRGKGIPPSRLGDVALAKGIFSRDQAEEALDVLTTRLHENLARHSSRIWRLFQEIRDGRAILLVGAGFSVPGPRDHGEEAPGLTGDSLCRYLLHEAKRGDKVPLNSGLPRVVEHLRKLVPEFDILYHIEEACRRGIPQNPLWQHQMLARLDPFRFIVTTNWDGLIERAYEQERGHGSLTVVQNDAEVPSINLARPTLIKLHGDFTGDRFDPKRPICLSTRDFIGIREESPILYALLETLYTTHNIVVVGFRPDDHNFTELYLRLAYRLGRRLGRVFLINRPRGRTYRTYPIDAVPINIEINEFLDYLALFFESRGRRIGYSSLPYGSRMGDSCRTSAHRCWAREACDLAGRLRAQLGLRHLEIVQLEPTMAEEERKVAVGRHASHLLRDWVCERDLVALGGGVTLRGLVDAVDPRWSNMKGVRLFATVTTAFDSFSVIAPITLVSLLAEKLHGLGVTASAFQIPERITRGCPAGCRVDGRTSPVCPACRPLREAMRKYRHVVGSECRLFLLGVGSMRLEHGGFQEACRRVAELLRGDAEEYRSMLRERGYIGDAMYRPFLKIDRPLTKAEDIDQYFLTNEKALREKDQAFRPFLQRLQRNIFATDLQAIRRAASSPNRQVVLVASGEKKAWPVLSLCRAGLAGAMIIDSTLAHVLTEIMNGGEGGRGPD